MIRTPVAFSVVIPSFNTAPFIGETLDSLAAQTYRDFEVLVVDDGSTDDSGRIAAERIAALGLRGTVTSRPTHLPKGVSSCRNLGIAQSKGAWIAFLDGDDLFTPTKLERVAEVVARTPRIAGPIYHKSPRFSHDSRQPLGVVSARGREGEPRWLLDELLVGNYLATCGMVIERALLEEVGRFNASLRGVEDWWLALQVSARTPWIYIDQALAEIRVRESSLMTNAAFDHYVEQHLALVRVASESGELSRVQLAALEGYALGALTTYFAGLALGREGWPGILPGLGRLTAAGHWRYAWRVIFRQVRSRSLVLASRLARKVRASRSQVA